MGFGLFCAPTHTVEPCRPRLSTSQLGFFLRASSWVFFFCAPPRPPEIGVSFARRSVDISAACFRECLRRKRGPQLGQLRRPAGVCESADFGPKRKSAISGDAVGGIRKSGSRQEFVGRGLLDPGGAFCGVAVGGPRVDQLRLLARPSGRDRPRSGARLSQSR